MSSIYFIDRRTGEKKIEKVYGGRALRFLYGDDLISRLLGPLLLHSLVKTAPFSALYGLWQKSTWTKKKILPFIEEYGVDRSEFLNDVDSFQSFNDFFVRKLKPEARPIASDPQVAIAPADGRYYFYQDISTHDGFIVKGQRFDLASLLGDSSLATQYEHGSMVMARLCPTDYHRYHFPCDCTPTVPHLINGWLHSVNPVAVKKNIHIFTENKRILSLLQTEPFGTVAFLAVGATNVGSINETYTPSVPCHKGDEKGFFSFGASALILLFPPGAIELDADLLAATKQGLEILCLMGQSIGRAKHY